MFILSSGISIDKVGRYGKNSLLKIFRGELHLYIDNFSTQNIMSITCIYKLYQEVMCRILEIVGGNIMDEKYQVIADALGELDEDGFLGAVSTITETCSNSKEAELVVKACAAGMEKVGDYFEEGEYFVGDLIYAADILKCGMDLLKPCLGAEGASKIGKMVIGSAPGDLHDIGKNIFISMMEAAGFEVIDLGVDVAPEQFVAKVQEVNPDIVGISGLLTLSLDTMGEVIAALEQAGVRNNVKVLIGGNPVSEAVMKRVGADAFSTNAATGVKQCKEWVVA